MYKTILVPLDGSLLGERALPVAASLAQIMKAKIVLTQAVQTPNLSTPITDTQVQAMDKTELYLKLKAKELINTGLEVEVGVPYASPIDGILDEINLRDVDLVVMTTHGRSGLSRLVYGSVAEAVLSHSPVPVLLIRSSAEDTQILFVEPKPTILVPLDGSSFAEEALPHAMALAQAMSGTIVLLHVYEPPLVTEMDITIHTDEVSAKLTKEQQKIEDYMTAMSHHIRQMGLDSQTILRSGDVVQTILEECWSAGASLVVMATHGRTGLRRALFGSVAIDVLRHGALPVMLIRPADFVPEREPERELVAG